MNRFAHNSGVSSICWMSNGQSLAVGCQQRYVSIYDLRASGASVPPINIDAHDGSVNGIEVDPSNPYVFATYSRGLAEPVKLWDSRRPDFKVSEIKLDSGTVGSGGEYSSVSRISWVPSCPGLLSVAVNESILYYDTYDARGNNSRPMLTRISNSHRNIQDLTFQPEITTSYEKKSHGKLERMLVAESGGLLRDLPVQQLAPVAISPRDGRVVNSTGNMIISGCATKGASAMESSEFTIDEDISATMMKRARCLHSSKYSTDAESNLELISKELDSYIYKFKNVDKDVNLDLFTWREQLCRLWSWVHRVETIIFRKNTPSVIDERRLPAKSLIDAGALKVLKFDQPNSDEITTFDTSIMSPIFNRAIFDSPMRRAVLTACGWIGQYGRADMLSAIENEGHYERSAALAVWNNDLGEAVAALQRGAENIRNRLSIAEDTDTGLGSYPETLDLVAMCIAGYSGGSKDNTSRDVWEKACSSLLKRSDLNVTKSYPSSQRAAYLSAICSFLIDVEQGNLSSTLNNKMLSLSDRVAFACIFLPRNELQKFLHSCVEDCIAVGNLEGILITGLNKQGVSLLQSYVDIYSDVQTVSLLSSRVIMPSSWSHERVLCMEWLEKYRDMLNTWQFWQSRSLFDVGRMELLRKLKERHQLDENVTTTIPGTSIRPIRRAGSAHSGRKYQPFSPTLKQGENEISLQPIPPQLHVRCNYCNTSLALSKLAQKQDGSIANNWLSRQNPVLSCCPNSQCRKPLPRCAICLLPLGCLNPYLELRKYGLQNTEDLSELKSLPFSEWFTWCMRCKHGGHAHHLQEWFGSHSVCPVSNCSCKCQFDGIQKLKRGGRKDIK
jgi:WD repeat-containing protein mio